MIGLTFSVRMEKSMTNLRHNNRNLTEEEYKQPAHEHIIRERTKDNIVIKHSTIQEAYQEVFGESVEAYNAKQKRKDRKIDDYYLHVYHSKTLDLQREMIIGLGNKQDWDELGYEKKKEAGQLIKEVIEDFIKDKKDHIHVYNAVIHLDEAGAPHAHINFIPLAHGYKNGLETQPSWTKSLAQMGYPGKGRKPFMAFRETEVERIGRIAKKYGIERKLGETNDIADVRMYKKVKELEKQAKAKEAEIEGLEQDYSQKDRELKRQAQEQAKVLDDFNKRLESKVNEKEVELELLDSELAEKQAEAQGAGESAQRARQEAQEAQDKADRLKAQIVETNQALSEKSELLNRQQAQLERNNRAIDEQIKQYEQNDYIEQRTRVLNDLEKASRVSYNDNHVRPNKLNPDEVIIKKEHYKNLKQRASFADIIGNFASSVVSKIQETSVYKALERKMQAEVNKWKQAYQKLKDKVKELEDELEKRNDEFFELNGKNEILEQKLAEEREIREKIDKYLEPEERRELANKIKQREQEEREEQEYINRRKNQGYWR